MINSIIDKNFNQRPVYITQDILGDKNGLSPDAEISKSYNKIPEGLAFRLTKDTLPHKLDPSNIDIRKLSKSLNDNDGHLFQGMKQTVLWYLLQANAEYSISSNQSSAAISFLKKGLTLDPANENIKAGIKQLENSKFQNSNKR